MKIQQRQIVNRIEQCAERSTDEEWEAGLQWYIQAHEYCKQLSNQYQQPLRTVVGIIAALSPQTRWSTNQEVAKNLIVYHNTGGYTGYKKNSKKAEDILAGSDPDTVLGGLKVRAFYDNILYPVTSEAVTVDTFTIQVALDTETLTRKQVDWGMHPECTGNRIIQDAYKRVSKQYNIRPCELQAVTWVVQHRRKS